MAIALERPVRRRARGTFDRVPYTVSLLPGDVLEFRQLKRRKTWVIELSTVMAIAVKRTIAAEKAQRIAARSARRAR